MPDADRPANDYRFLNWCYVPERRLLSGPHGEVRLKPLLDRLLRRLLDESGSVLTREQLIAEVWTRREVNDEVLSRAIAELRSMLGDDARDPRFIETLPKGGYRWIAPLRSEDGETSPALSQGDASIDAVTVSSSGRRRAATALVILAGLAAVVWLVRGERIDGRASLAMDLLQARPLATDTRLEHDARFDSAGHVIYIRTDPASGSAELVMVDPASMAERVLWESTAALRYPAPAPDGREVAVMRKDGQSCEIWSVSVVDTRRSRLGECSVDEAGGLEWVNGGASLVYTGSAMDDRHASGLMLLDRPGKKIRRLTTPDVEEGAHVQPRLSADGKTLVYASMHGNEGQLWKTDWPLMRHRQALLRHPEPLFGHAFEPQGDTLWIAGDLTLYRALHRLRSDHGPELIGGRGARSIDLASDGAAVWSEANYDADIWLLSANGATWKTIARSNRYESQPEFSADGSKLALVSNRNGAESVLVHDLADGSSRQLSLDARFRWVRPTWSARQPSLIITAYEGQSTRLYRYVLDGDILGPLPNVDAGAFLGVELADRLLYLDGHGTGQSTLMQLRAGRSQPESLGLGPVTTFRASTDWLVWLSPGSNDLHAAPLPGLDPIRVINRSGAVQDEAFALNGRSLYYVDKGGLWTLELPDAQAEPVSIEHVPDGSGPSLAISSKGAMAVVTQTSLSIDLMLSEGSAAAR